MGAYDTVLTDMNRFVIKDVIKSGKQPSLDTVIDPQAHLTHYGRVVVLGYLFRKHYADREYKLAVGVALVEYRSSYLLADFEILEELRDSMKSPKIVRDFYASVLIALDAMDKSNLYYGQILGIWEQLDKECPHKKRRKLLN